MTISITLSLPEDRTIADLLLFAKLTAAVTFFAACLFALALLIQFVVVTVVPVICALACILWSILTVAVAVALVVAKLALFFGAIAALLWGAYPYLVG